MLLPTLMQYPISTNILEGTINVKIKIDFEQLSLGAVIDVSPHITVDCYSSIFIGNTLLCWYASAVGETEQPD